MSNNAMSNETDLDWLARNVHHWGSDHARTISYSTEFGGERYGDGLPYPKYTKAQWLASRAELQNKPSWKDAPEWAQWLAQHESGYWGWGSGVANATECTWKASAPAPQFIGKMQWSGCAGEVLGDWRDTLERRPDAKTRAQAEIDLVNAAAEVFQPFTSIEDNQGKVMAQQAASQQSEKQQDNSWFERGELPPVGMECEFIRHDDVHWHDKLTTGSRVKTLAHYSPCDDGVMVAVFSFDASDDVETGSEVDQGVVLCFRPIRTEREKVIEEMKQHCPYPGSWNSTYKQFAEALHEAGYRKEPQ